MKIALVKIETPGSGPDPLGRFGAGGMHDRTWEFLESVLVLDLP